METINERLQTGRGQVQDISIVDTTTWNDVQTEEIVNNPTLLYIAVEYVKDYKGEDPNSTVTSQEVYSEFDSHVSPLDPNMSSVASYSPIYNDSSAEYNPVVIHQLVTQNGTVQNDQYISNLNAASLDNIPTVLCNNDRGEVSNEFLQMVDQSESDIVNTNADALQLVPEREQKVELLITDEATGISYSVDAQELLVEPCLQDDQHLLETLAPDPILESDLLTLDERTLKSELNDDLDMCSNEIASLHSQAVNNYINNLSENEINKSTNDAIDFSKVATRQNRRSDMDTDDDQFLSCVYSITDKPILTRARATLPEPYLTFGKVNGETTVLAKKAIPKRSQFGPLEGVLVAAKDDPAVLKNLEHDKLIFLVETEGELFRIDVTDENHSNWMMFVRRATTFDEQNLVITQDNNAIYFTTTTNIQPKQELKVWYSNVYGQYYNFPVFQPIQELSWPCFECASKFESSEELQKHLDIHDKEKDENTKPKKKIIHKIKRKLFKKNNDDAVECQLCQEMFFQYNYNSLRLHILQKHESAKGTVEEYFTIINFFKCDVCNISFKSEALLKIHNFKHNPDTSEEQRNHICPECQKKYPTQRQLVLHVSHHVIVTVGQVKKIKCTICHKIFSHQERLQKHMIVHGSDDAKPLQCKTCYKRFFNNSALACHAKTHYTEKKPFECPICKEAFDHVLKLKLHVPNHCENNCFTCPHCHKIFKKYSIIRKHIRAFHCERTHECTNCSKIFPTLDKLKSHLLKHSDHREFLCAHCGKQFKRKDKLKEHCKKIHSEERENTIPDAPKKGEKIKKFMPKVEPTDFHRFIYKCHSCMVGFKRRGMLVNHLAKRHPDIRPDSVPELNLPILQTTRDYYCQYCDKVYKSSSKRKAHILKNHPGAALPMSNRKQGSLQEVSGLPNPTFSQTVGSITTRPQNCKWCHKQYASKAKLLQHQRKKHFDLLALDPMRRQSKDDIQDKNYDSEIIVDKIEKKDNNNDAVTEFDKVVENMISDQLETFNLEEETQYCHIPINESENFIESNELENPNSQLYRLLTTNNGMLPPR